MGVGEEATEISQIMKEADTDKDGQISYIEFKVLMMNVSKVN